MDKKVIVYGIEGTFSAGLKKSASEVRIYSKSEVLNWKYEKMIISNLAYCAAHPGINMSFSSTLKAIMKRNEEISEDNLRYTLNKLINDGFLHRAKKQISPDLTLPIILPDWDRISETGLCDASEIDRLIH